MAFFLLSFNHIGTNFNIFTTFDPFLRMNIKSKYVSSVTTYSRSKKYDKLKHIKPYIKESDER